MPKVKESYFEQKRKEILDATFAISMRKPMYDVSMRDIISESGFSQGGIYRYFPNADAIFIALINRDCILFDTSAKLDALQNSSLSPERIVYESLFIWKQIVLDNLIGVGKIYFELCSVYASDKEKYTDFIKNITIASEEEKFKQKGIMYAIRQIESGYFIPKVPIEDIIFFLATSLDGIIRDVILYKHYQLPTNLPNGGQLDEHKLMHTLAVAFITLLGGNELKIFEEELHNESSA
ncbi:MAG: TetR/AcrR family transcriptional regulator [Lachnospiraceae bacterium]|nr:TetR/AcrR family transcriptional regulator [Lachnospiraceae bacterium]